MKKILEKMEEMVEVVEDHARLPIEPLVSVFMTTYNHERFITQALDGILMQEVDFPYEIVIGEDKSTDRTREIVCEYQRKHPDKIRLHLSKENLYSKNLKPGWAVLAASRGKYIAMCEGDDCWTDPQKLREQVAVLETEPEISACFTNAAVVNEDGSEQPSVFLGEPSVGYWRPPKHGYVSQSDLIAGHCVPTATLCFRSMYVRELPEWYFKMPVGDWPLCMILSGNGPLKYLDSITATYSRHQGGMHTRLSPWEKLRQELEIYVIYQPYAPSSAQPFLHARIQHLKKQLKDAAIAIMVKLIDMRDVGKLKLHENELKAYFSKQECRQIGMTAWERYFQEAYFRGDASVARRRLAGLTVRHPEWLLNRGSVGQIVRTLLGRCHIK